MLQVFDIYLYVWRKRLCDFRISGLLEYFAFMVYVKSQKSFLLPLPYIVVLFVFFQKYVFQAQEGKAPFP